MAKRQKTKAFSFQGFDNAHYKTTAAYTRAVNELFDKATSDIAEAANKEDYNPNKPFSFDDYPRAKTRLQTTLKGLAKKMQAVVETGSRRQWLFACKKNEEFISSIFDTTKLAKGKIKKMQDRNLDALQAFQQRKVGGMDLSERVWKYTEQYKEQIEIGLDVGLGEGRSAQQLSRDLRQNLKDPDRLFRRVRDKRGNLQLSKAAKAFHPGRGVYRSSYKNAMRLTRSEINMAYRESDHLRWQQLDFIVGFEVHRSNREPQFKCKLCDRLVGCYPKWFKYKGFHPQCMCYATPILMDEEDFDNQELSDLKSALKGTEYKKYSAKNAVTDLPEEFKKWVEENAPRQRYWKSTPYFIKDNFVDGDLTKGLRYIPSVKPTATSVDFAFDYDTPNESLDAYISGEAMWLNNYLRGRGDFGALSKEEQSLLDELTTITQKEKVGERVLWRSVDARAIFGDMSDSEYEDLLGRLVYGDDRRAIIEMTQKFLDVSGTKQEEKGFMSTTKDKNIAMQWGGYTGSRTPVLLKIKTTAETRGIDVERYTLIHNPQAEREQPQKEVLLRRGLQYKVVAIKELEGHICVEVELLDNANENSKQASTVDPIQQELDALQPQIVSIRQKSAEWGLNTPLLDAALAARNPKDVVLAISSLKNRVNNAINELKVFIADVEATIKEAKVNKVDSNDVFADLQSVKSDKRYWLMGKDAMKQRLEGLKAKIRSLLNPAHPAILSKYETNEQVNTTFKTINSEFTTEKWFEHGDLSLTLTRESGVNGSTNMYGRISLKPDRLERVKSALSKIGSGKPKDITFEEADAMATFWHEITHNRNIPGNMDLTDTQRDVMEMMNEFVARKTLPEFYKRLGCAITPHPEFITDRASTGYNRRVRGYDFVISKLGLDPGKVLESAKKNLFTLKYTEQDTTAKQALLDGGLDEFVGANGKKIGKAQLNKIVAMCRKGYFTTAIEDYLRDQGII